MANRIYGTDALAFLRGAEGGFIDTTVTSPPYNKGESGAVLVKAVRYHGSSDKKPEGEYQQEQKDVLTELYRCTKDGGSCFYNHKTRWVNNQPIHPFEWLRETPWQIRQVIVWNRKLAAQIKPWRFWQTHEDIYWLWKPNGLTPKENAIPQSVSPLGSVWDIRPFYTRDKSDPLHKHPCVFPLEIPRRAILATTNEGDLVFDPYMGSGTTAVAAKLLRRNYLGCEISPEYVRVARDRVAAA